MGQSSSHHVATSNDTHRATHLKTINSTRPFKNADEVARPSYRPPNPRQTDAYHLATQVTQSSRGRPGTTYRNVAPTSSHKRKPAQYSVKLTSQRKFPTPDQRYYYDETEPKSKNPRLGSQLSLTKPIRQTPRQKKVCVICTDNRSLSRFPSDPPTARCAHKANVCRRCLRKWIETTFADKVWDEINCPICSEHMKYEDVRKFAPSEIYRKYKRLSTKAALEAIPGFHWCLTRGCKSGQAVDPGSYKFCCITCKKTYCLEHQVRWHKGETCKEYEYRTNKKLKGQEEMASKKWLKDRAKACPGCKRPIEKANGCDHMKCTKCRHEFCWECLAPHKKLRTSTTLSHRVGCVHHIARADADLGEETFLVYRP